MTHVPPPAEELRLLDAELWRLDVRRAQLLARRAWLLSVLRPDPQPDAPRPGLRSPQPAWGPPVAPPRPEASAPGVQNALLLLGGVLLTLAAMVFTLVSWGHLGMTGRCAVLGALTLAVSAAPVALLRRGLRSTAESVAGLGAALTALDAYALHEAGLTAVDGTAYAAIATAVLAGLWAGYGRALDALRLPLPAALAAAQLPLLLGAIAVDAGAYGVTAALLVTAGADTVVALRAATRPVRYVAVGGACGLGAWGASAAGWLSWTATGPGAAARAAALLCLAAAIALGAAWTARPPSAALVTAPVGGLLAVAAGGGLLRTLLPDGWTVPACLVCGVALLAAPRGRLPEPVRVGLLRASGAVQLVALAAALPLLAVTWAGPLGRAGRTWSGAPADARTAVTAYLPWPTHAPQLLIAPALVAVVLVVLVRDEVGRPRALAGALVLAWGTAFALPAVLALPYAAGLWAQGAVTAAALATVAGGRLHPLPRLTATVLAVAGSLSLAFLALATETATLAVLTVLTVLFAAASGRREATAVTAPAALVHAAALACATGAAVGWPTRYTALLVLVVPVAAAGLAALLAVRPGASGARVPVEVTGAAAALLAAGLAVTEPAFLALVLALTGVIAAATAVRADRRPVGHAAAALFVLAAWVRLASWGVGAPEAYALPVALPALCVGVLRRHRDPSVTSWTAYGPALGVMLLPSLAAVWGDQQGPRPLLLGTAALLVTVVGARHRLKAPLVLGGTTLVLDCLHELAPYLVQLAGVLPRWMPPALAGLLLLALGATYERRIRDVRRVREVLGRMD
ncbi:SCO7613 C-terminal domain-containing membrane protein [Streptomyces sp. NPDC059378]|uniref:SCO7613 C-terminal domain-containing membrane protein n=1 Tax=Streptomyces sp. NPDC059378 TaxID=3346815 RepID=UPI0036CA920F